MIEFLILALIGIAIGVLTGLIPGLHVNNVAIIAFSLFPFLNLSPIEFSILLVSISIVHQFIEFVPAIFLGVPDESTALSILPAHRMMLAGKGIEALKLIAFGCFFGLFFGLVLLVPAFLIIPSLYESSRGLIVFVLIAIIFFLILREKKAKKILLAVFVLLISGYFGLISLNLKILSSSQVLFPVFAGLFGLSNIAASLQEKIIRIPQDEFITLKIKKKFFSSALLGAIGGMIIGTLPAMSPSQLGVLMYEILGTDIRNFLISVSAINTSDSIFSLVSIYTIENARSGVAAMINAVIDINFTTVILFIGIIAFVSFFSLALILKIGRKALKFSGKVNYRNMCIFSFLLITSLVFLFTGFFGVIIVFIGMIIGLIPIRAGVSRTHCMGVLLIPTIIYFLGV